VANFKVLSRPLDGGTDKNYESPLSGQSVRPDLNRAPPKQKSNASALELARSLAPVTALNSINFYAIHFSRLRNLFPY
jgi:hypothetical protein